MNFLHNWDEDGYRYEDEYHHPHQEECYGYYGDAHEYAKTLRLRPRNIRFSQDSIGCRFSNGPRLASVFAHLISGSLKVADLPRIEVLSMNGHFWVVSGNRRLYLYRMLEQVDVVDRISVAKSSVRPTSKLFKRKFTNACNGKRIYCRQKSLLPSLNKIVSGWGRGKDVVAKWDPWNHVLAFRDGYRVDFKYDDQNYPDIYGYDEGGDNYEEQYDEQEEEDYNYQDEYDYQYEDDDYYHDQDEYDDYYDDYVYG